MEEIWSAIPDFPNTEVSSIGRIRSLFGGGCKLRSQQTNSHGYKVIKLQNKDRIKNFKVHVLVAGAFVGPNPGGLDVNHKDGVKANNVFTNLEYMTRSENCKHGFRLGLSYTPFRERGEKHCRAKLTDAAVLSLRAEHAAGESLKSLAAKHGVSYYCAWDVVKRRSYSHI
jgi:hypothetical protein